MLRLHTKLRLVVDLQNCAKAQASRAYARKVKMSNLQQMAQTICYVQKHGYMTQADLEHEREVTEAAIDNLSNTIKRTNRKLSGLHDSDKYWRDQLLHTRNTLQDNQKNLRKYLRELQIVCTNVNTILNLTHQQNRKTEKEQEL